jgi:uncharacterized Zn finger protein
MSTISVSEIDLVMLIPERLINRGSQYFEDNRLSQLKAFDGSISGACKGSKSEPYQVVVYGDQNGVSDTRCTCPIGARCMHVAALLFGWIHERSRFEGADNRSIDDLLAGMPAETLRFWLKRALERIPELEFELRA